MKNPFSSQTYPYWTGQPVSDTYSCCCAVPHLATQCPNPIADGDASYRLSNLLLPHVKRKTDLGPIIEQIQQIFKLQYKHERNKRS